MSFKEKILSLSKYMPLISFLALEVFGIISFSLGNSVILFGALSLLLALLIFIFSYNDIVKNGFSPSLYILFPLVLYVFLFAFGSYASAHIQAQDFSLVDVIFAGLGTIAMGFSGYVLSINKSIKISHLLIVVYSGIALLVFINLIINLINFGAFHTIIYKNYYMYYAGKRSDVTASEIAYVLEGFKFIEARIEHYTLFPVILLSSAFILPFNSYKENKIKFFVNIGFVALSVISLVLIPSILGLAFGIIILALTLYIYFFKKYRFNLKASKIILFVILGIAAVILLIMLLNTQDFSKGFASVIANNPILNRLFNTNPFTRAFNPLITNVLCSNRFFGYYAHEQVYFISDLAHLSNSILFDGFMITGVLGIVLLGVFFYMGFKGSSKIKVTSDKELMEKIGLIGLAAIYLMYSMLGGYGEYAIYHRVVRPANMSGLFMVIVFVICYLSAYGNSFKKEESSDEIKL